VEQILLRRRLVCYLRPGAGKTLTAFGVFLRLKYDPSFVAEDGVYLVITEANLIQQVWMKQAWEHGLYSYIDTKQLRIVSFGTLASGDMRRALDVKTGTLEGRKIVAVIVDEAGIYSQKITSPMHDMSLV
jgi:hypothetical protein